MNTTQNTNTIQVEFGNIFQQHEENYIQNIIMEECENLNDFASLNNCKKVIEYTFSVFNWDKFHKTLCERMVIIFGAITGDEIFGNAYKFTGKCEYVKTFLDSLSNSKFVINMPKKDYSIYKNLVEDIDILENVFFVIAEKWTKINDKTIDGIFEDEKLRDLYNFLNVPDYEYKQNIMKILECNKQLN